MLASERVVCELRRRGELWQHAPGLIGLRGSALEQHDWLEGELHALARADGAEEWRVPSAITFTALARADYFASFPQWLTAVTHLDTDTAVLERVAAAAEPAVEAARALRPAGAGLLPAVCYHVYTELAGQHLERARLVTAQCTCWRHEGDDFAPLERGWSFGMREAVCVGTAAEVEAFRQRGMERALALAERLGLAATIEAAADPFFAPTARGRSVLQKVKCLKHELRLSIGDGRTVAAASFNNHERFFGERFAIRDAAGAAASSGCVAFGIERWLLAWLVAQGFAARS